MHDVPSAHSFPFVKQDRSTCRRYMRTVYCQNGEPVSRTVLTLCFQLVSRGPPGNWHAAVSARVESYIAYFQVAPSNHEEVYNGQLPKVAAHAVEWRRVLSRRLDRTAPTRTVMTYIRDF